MSNFSIKAEKAEGLNLTIDQIEIVDNNALDSIAEYNQMETSEDSLLLPPPEDPEPIIEEAPAGSGVGGTIGAIIVTITALGGISEILKIFESDLISGIGIHLSHFFTNNLLYIVIMIACYTAYKIHSKHIKSASFRKQMEINADPNLNNIKVVAGAKGKWWKFW